MGFNVTSHLDLLLKLSGCLGHRKHQQILKTCRLGRTGMIQTRFEASWRNTIFSQQPNTHPLHMSYAQHCWQLVGNFINKINSHWSRFYYPSDLICVDKSFSWFCGYGGYWIRKGLPMYIVIDRNPENGCEIQNACDACSRIMMQHKVVKDGKDEEWRIYVFHARLGNQVDSVEMLHGTKVILLVLKPYLNRPGGCRCVCADSYFASVVTVKGLEGSTWASLELSRQLITDTHWTIFRKWNFNSKEIWIILWQQIAIILRTWLCLLGWIEISAVLQEMPEQLKKMSQSTGCNGGSYLQPWWWMIPSW